MQHHHTPRRSSAATTPHGLIQLLPPNYIASTTTAERQAHFELYHRLHTSANIMEMSAVESSEGLNVLYLVFHDRPGSLSAITSALGNHDINIQHVSAFSTIDKSRIAIDTLQISEFSTAAMAAIDSAIARLSAEAPATAPPLPSPHQRLPAPAGDSTQDDMLPVAGSVSPIGELPADYLNATTPEERASHQEMYHLIRSGAAGDVVLRWAPAGAGVLLHLVFIDCLGSLSTITSVLNDRGINVQRVAAFCTAGGVAVDTFQLSLLDQQTADIVEARLAAQIAEEQRIALTVEASSSMFGLGHNAVSFTISRAAHLLPRGLGGYYKETLTIGEKWLMYGKHRVMANDITSITNDLDDACKLHLCFRQLRRTLTISFPGGQEQCRRAYMLLCRLRQPPGPTAMPDGYPSPSPGGPSVTTSLPAGATASAGVGGAVAPSAVGVPIERGALGQGYARAQHEERSLRRLTLLQTMCCLLAFLIAAGAMYSMTGVAFHSSVTAKQLHPASCIVRELAPQIESVPVAERCRSVAGEVPHCAFFAMTPGWSVDVQLLSQYPQGLSKAARRGGYSTETSLARVGLDRTRGGASWHALALPTLRSSSFRQIAHERSTILEGACSGEVWLSVNETIAFCMAHRTQWMAELVDGLSYLCYAERHGAYNVYFDVSTPPSRYLASLLTGLVALAAVGLAIGFIFTLKRGGRAGQPAAPHASTILGTDAAATSSDRASGVSDEDDADVESTVTSSDSPPMRVGAGGAGYQFLPDARPGLLYDSEEAFAGAARAARLSTSSVSPSMSAKPPGPGLVRTPSGLSLGRWFHRRHETSPAPSPPAVRRNSPTNPYGTLHERRVDKSASSLHESAPPPASAPSAGESTELM